MSWHTDTSTQESTQNEIAKQEMIALYEHHHKVVPRDQDLFYTAKEEHFAQEPMSK